MREVRNAYNILVEKPVGKRPLGKYWRRWEGNIRMDLRKIGSEGVDWIHLARGRDKIVDSFQYSNESSGYI
jgi:hypothetical protein